ncbi:uncharacterized [Tachysurus ichikawai]
MKRHSGFGSFSVNTRPVRSAWDVACTSACTGDMRLAGVACRHGLYRGSPLICREHMKSICLFLLYTGGYKAFGGDVRRDNGSLCEDMTG